MTDELVIGKIRTSYGVKGQIKVFPYSGETEHFLKLGSLVLCQGDRRKEFLVEEVLVRSGELIMKLSGLDTPEAVKSYNGWDIVVSRDRAAPLSEGEYYLADLVGCDVVFKGEKTGSVLSVVEGGGGDMLEVTRLDGSMCYVPFRKEFIGEVNTESKTIELLVDWIMS